MPGGDSTKLDDKRPARAFSPFSLDALNFFLADVQGAFGPYLNVFLVTQQHWSQSQVGFVTACAGLLGIAANAPVGAAIDATHAKRGAIVLALVLLSSAGLVIYFFPFYWPVLIASIVMALVGSVFGPAIAAITLGLYTRKALAGRIARNSAFDHAGNVATALLAGLVGYVFSQRTVFLLAPVAALFSALSVLSIPGRAIDHDRARGMEKTLEEISDTQSEREKGDDKKHATDYGALFKSRPLLIFGLCVMLFHFANAPMLPLVGQKLAYANPKAATAMMSFCIIAAQIVMLPIALLVGHKANSWGRKPLLLLAFAVLPLRACLYTLSDNTTWLISVQLLDGVGAGLMAPLTPLVIADITRRSAHFNLAQGAVATVQGIGASLSGLVAGLLVDYFKYNVTFFALGAAAAVALIVLYLLMPETSGADLGASSGRGGAVDS
jgi:MFS family permease